MWLALPFYDFCGFRSVAVNSVYKLQFFYIYFIICPMLYAIAMGQIINSHSRKKTTNATLRCMLTTSLSVDEYA